LITKRGSGFFKHLASSGGAVGGRRAERVAGESTGVVGEVAQPVAVLPYSETVPPALDATDAVVPASLARREETGRFDLELAKPPRLLYRPLSAPNPDGP